jgi:hypothetical protein
MPILFSSFSPQQPDAKTGIKSVTNKAVIRFNAQNLLLIRFSPFSVLLASFPFSFSLHFCAVYTQASFASSTTGLLLPYLSVLLALSAWPAKGKAPLPT